ncbi:MAG TPA: farnesyl diphosphate synthase [Candidatus Limnocylindrales bacterium]|nr:farnesyl diphosphate synthase [Candidatus Limnocylindrales bacterium]
MASPAIDEIARRRMRVEESLLRFLHRDVCEMPAKLREAVEYSLTGGGKRIRPVVLLSAGGAVGGDEEKLLPFACAMEYVHTYSLVHDDLPAMDDDDYRRGRPSCHKAFGEATAILAGDALLTEAFRVMGESALALAEPGRALAAVSVLARAAGAEGMVGGQQMDLSAEGSRGGRAEIEEIDLRKTSALLSAAARMGGILGGGNGAQVEDLARYGRALGLLFQVTDDILDETGSFEEMGKGVAKDKARGKLTYPGAFGMAAAVARAESLSCEALSAVSAFGEDGEALRDIVRMVAARRS